MSEKSSPAQAFQVDLRGVVDLLSRHIYSSPQVYLRELLQNGRDAIVARRKFDADAPVGEIRITPVTRHNPAFTFTDNGVGLTAEDAAEFLATVGRSSKRDGLTDLRSEDFLGQFGIGILSCFMVADAITVRSRSARGGPAIEWVGTTDGTFTMRELEPDADVPVGTEVRLVPRADDAALVSPERVTALAERFGRYLPERVSVFRADSWHLVSADPYFLAPVLDRDEARSQARELLGVDALDVIEIDVPGTGTRGVAYVLPFAPAPGTRQSHQVYLGRMLLNERLPELLPDWAFFVRCVLNTEGLSPTASREQLIDDSSLEFTRDEIGRILRRWILQQATANPVQFAQFLAVHHLALKVIALEDDDLAAAVLPHLAVETSAGTMTLGELAGRFGSIRYTKTVDEFRQIAAVASAESPVVNGGYTYEVEVIRRMPHILAGVRVEQLRVTDVLDELAYPALDQREKAQALEARSSAVLADRQCEVVARVFQPHSLNALYVADPEVFRAWERNRASKVAPKMWADLLGDVDDMAHEQRANSGAAEPASRLCLNWASPLVQHLSQLGDPLVFDRSIKLLYAQALLTGHHPLQGADRTLLNDAMTDLIHLSVTTDPEDSL